MLELVRGCELRPRRCLFSCALALQALCVRNLTVFSSRTGWLQCNARGHGDLLDELRFDLAHPRLLRVHRRRQHRRAERSGTPPTLTCTSPPTAQAGSIKQMSLCQTYTYTRAHAAECDIVVACMCTANELSSSANFEFVDVWPCVHNHLSAVGVALQRLCSSTLSYRQRLKQ